MAYATPRSATAAMREGMTDGKYRKVIMDRGGFPESCTYDSRSDLFDGWYGIHEAPVKMAPDNVRCHTPNTVITPPPHPEAI